MVENVVDVGVVDNEVGAVENVVRTVENEGDVRATEHVGGAGKTPRSARKVRASNPYRKRSPTSEL